MKSNFNSISKAQLLEYPDRRRVDFDLDVIKDCNFQVAFIDDDEKFLMENQTLYPKSKKDIAREKEIERMKKNLGNILVSPFNYDNWSQL